MEDISANFSSLRPKPLEISDVEKQDMELLVMGRSPIKLAFRMYDVVLKYAQTFERNEKFKSDMSTRYHDLVNSERISSDYFEVPQSRITTSNSFMNEPEPKHPVELGLRTANLLSHGVQIDRFLDERNAVLLYLEPQYQRIADAAQATSSYVKSKKRILQFLAPDWENIIHKPVGRDWYRVRPADLVKAMFYLEDYADTFVRDVPRATRGNIRVMQPGFDVYYSALPREEMLNRMSGMLSRLVNEPYGEMCHKVVCQFIRYFKTMVDDMDNQYLEIRQARKSLFDFDGEATLHVML